VALWVTSGTRCATWLFEPVSGAAGGAVRCRGMRRLLSAVVAALACTASAQAAVPNPDARAFYVVNTSTGEVLASRGAHVVLPVASISKLMTVIVALDHLKPDGVVTITRKAAAAGEERIPLFPGQRISVRDLLAGALIQSANDAADALAAAASGGDVAGFVSWMNQRAQKLGLHDTHFARPDGLDAPGHVSSARDVAVLAEAAMRLPVVRSIVRERSAPIENGRFVVHTWNDLLGVFPGLIGVKTGHTGKAGWCQVAAVKRLGYTIYAVILGSPTRGQRNDDLQRLLAWSVSQYRSVAVVRRATYAVAALGYGRRPLALVTPRRLVLVVRTGRPLVERVIAPDTVKLPVTRGQGLGRVEIWDGRKLLGTRPLLAARSVPRPGVGGRLRWYATRTVKHVLAVFR
jgi:serine-type D-Ala-D-Ala carboxypeptidase (penicillin-binding protein 5/6)